MRRNTQNTLSIKTAPPVYALVLAFAVAVGPFSY
jgi:predicted permease